MNLEVNIKEQFLVLKDKWWSEIMIVSNRYTIIENKYYLEIIALGPIVLNFLIEDTIGENNKLGTTMKNGHWYWHTAQFM